MFKIKKQEKSLGQILMQGGFISKEQLDGALLEQKKTGELIGKLLVRKGLVQEDDIINALKGILSVVFKVNGELFAVEVVFSREILHPKKITPLPGLPDFMLGVIGVRNKVAPVISLNRRIFNKDDEFGENSRIIILDIKDDTAGILVDGVLMVKKFQTNDFERNLDSGVVSEKKYVEGVIKQGGEIITMLNPDALIDGKK